MTTSYIRTAFCALALTTALPVTAQAEEGVVISCFRGPWHEVIWDAANTKFVDSLMSIGYDVASAQAIATRVCRDQDAVGNSEALVALTKKLIAETPRRGRH